MIMWFNFPEWSHEGQSVGWHVLNIETHRNQEIHTHIYTHTNTDTRNSETGKRVAKKAKPSMEMNIKGVAADILHGVAVILHGITSILSYVPDILHIHTQNFGLVAKKLIITF